MTARHTLLIAALAGLLAIQGCGKGDTTAAKEDAKDAKQGVTLTQEELDGLALATAKLPAASYRGQLTGYGVVTGLDAIGQTDADTATAEAAAAQSSAAAARARELSAGEDAPVSRETYEAAAAKAASDQAALALARRKADAAFGLAAPWRSGMDRSAIMTRLQSGRTVLVRATFPAGVTAEAQRLSVSRMGEAGKSWTATTVWEAPADPAVPGHSFFALVDGSDLAQGERVTAALPQGAAQAGVIVPASALILGENEAWAYLKTAPDNFLRTRIDISRPQGDGYFVAEGLKPDQEVVTRGAGQLYAHEINPSTEPEE